MWKLPSCRDVNALLNAQRAGVLSLLKFSPFDLRRSVAAHSLRLLRQREDDGFVAQNVLELEGITLLLRGKRKVQIAGHRSRSIALRQSLLAEFGFHNLAIAIAGYWPGVAIANSNANVGSRGNAMNFLRPAGYGIDDSSRLVPHADTLGGDYFASLLVAVLDSGGNDPRAQGLDGFLTTCSLQREIVE